MPTVRISCRTRFSVCSGVPVPGWVSDWICLSSVAMRSWRVKTRVLVRVVTRWMAAATLSCQVMGERVKGRGSRVEWGNWGCASLRIQKLQASKFQAHFQISNSERRAFGILVLGVSLVFGVWDLELRGGACITSQLLISGWRSVFRQDAGSTLVTRHSSLVTCHTSLRHV
jgi:hypothetical protein